MLSTAVYIYCIYYVLHDLLLTSMPSVFISAIFDRSGRYVITGSDDRLVKIWSMETAFCLASCRGHEVHMSLRFVDHQPVLF